jgi:tetratricopeptide (TPR) repeat protein
VTVHRDELENEREFLLRSLDDLDAELAAGNIDEASYRVLRDDYTARASRVIRSLEGPAAPPSGEPAGRRRAPTTMRVAIAGGIVVFSVAAAFLLARSVGQRPPGGTITGNQQGAPRPAPTFDPNTYEGRIASARALLQQRDYPAAVAEFTAANRIDPTQPEPLAYRGWISGLVAREVGDAATRAQLLERAHADLDQAIEADPDFGDAYFFMGYLLFAIENKPAEAIAPLQQFLVRTPHDHPMRSRVLELLAQAERARPSQP